jgi:UDP-GlcNAc:undecaprenyl-phosphate GlcNAc-1-phosphate transferase
MFHLGLGVFVITYLCVAAVRKWSLKHNVLDIPNDRRLNSVPIPRGGGLAIVIVTLIGIGFLWYIKPDWLIGNLFIFILGAILIAGVSLWDDIHPLPYWIRLAVHLIVAGAVVIGIGNWQVFQFPLLGTVDLRWLGVPVTILWIVGMINAFNFMDGIDGIAGSQGVVAGIGWAIIGILSKEYFIAGIGVIMAASCLGFLGHNWPPAKVFMGDVGSTFLGYTFAILPVVVGQHDSQLALAGILFLWLFIFDTAVTFLRRLLRHENVFSAHLTHFYQRLAATGFSHKRITFLYTILSIFVITCSVAMVMKWPWADVLVTMIIVTTSLILWLGTRWREKSVSTIV